jgi:hypothetical protein
MSRRPLDATAPERVQRGPPRAGPLLLRLDEGRPG